MAIHSNRPPFISTQTREGKYLFLDLKPPRRVRLAVVCVGKEVCMPDYRIDRSSFEYHVLEFVVSGNWRLEYGGSTMELRPGALFAYGPEVAYSLTAEPGSEHIKYFVSFGGHGADELLGACGLRESRVRYTQQPRWLHDLFDQLLECGSLNPSDVRDMTTRLTELILRRVKFDSWTEESRESESRSTYLRCRTFIEENYLDLRSVGEIARQCSVDPAYLARMFKRFGDERPLQYLTRLKTNHAADLIMSGGYKVAQAGQAVGFSDPYHFSRVFKRVHGLPPGRIPRR